MFVVDGSELLLYVVCVGFGFVVLMMLLYVVYVIDCVVCLIDVVLVCVFEDVYCVEGEDVFVKIGLLFYVIGNLIKCGIVEMCLISDDVVYVLMCDVVYWCVELLVVGMYGCWGIVVWLIGSVVWCVVYFV